MVWSDGNGYVQHGTVHAAFVRNPRMLWNYLNGIETVVVDISICVSAKIGCVGLGRC